MTKRVFLAIEIHPEPELLDLFDLLRDELAGEQIKWVDEDQLHITLKFFGDTDESKIKDISAAVKDCCLHHNRFSFGLCNPWYFRKRGQPSVVLLKTARTDELITLQNQLDSLFVGLGIPKEDQAFKPHLTLGRIKSMCSMQSFYNLMEEFPQRTIQTVPVRELILFESILKPSGPEYRMLERFKLAEDS
jgi:2'-5' RNA ligase